MRKIERALRKKMKTTTLLLLTLLSLTACQENKPTKPTKVQKEQPFSEAFYKCTKEIGTNTIGISHCYEEELKYQDGKLNLAYKKVKSSIQPFRLNDLKEVQRSWMKYRDIKCSFFNHKESGQTGSIEEQECIVKETISRTKELQGLN